MSSLFLKIAVILIVHFVFAQCNEDVVSIRMDGVDLVASNDKTIDSCQNIQVVYAKNKKRPNDPLLAVLGYMIYIDETVCRISGIKNKKDRLTGLDILLEKKNGKPGSIKAEIDCKGPNSGAHLVLKQITTPSSLLSKDGKQKAFIIFVAKSPS
ncbi:hypothetical protein NEMIN01_1408 [Nematocida minor]|uniref:uncharacterized protein n=1 Tax=Nematocida minor TaxID=1912983 RepID=UPI00221E7B4E|nr:uncharacterized protein NEMIN01_1408 [Nematocida minor]KAI5191200.1 hypothetical protein NEMIN01_1408 [Nematocida minor]